MKWHKVEGAFIPDLMGCEAESRFGPDFGICHEPARVVVSVDGIGWKYVCTSHFHGLPAQGKEPCHQRT